MRTSFLKDIGLMEKLEEHEIQLCFYGRFLIFLLPNRISVLMMFNDD